MTAEGEAQADARVRRKRQRRDAQLGSAPAPAVAARAVRVARRHDGDRVTGGARRVRDPPDHGRDPVDLGEIGVGDECDSHADRIGVRCQAGVTRALRLGNGRIPWKREADRGAADFNTLSATTRPPWASTMCLTMARPRPVPPSLRLRAGPRGRTARRSGRCSAGMPRRGRHVDRASIAAVVRRAGAP